MHEQTQQDTANDGPEIGRSAARLNRRAQALVTRHRSGQLPDDVAGAREDTDPVGDRRPPEDADRVRANDEAVAVEREEELNADTEDAAERLRRNAETVRQAGEGIKEVHERLQSTADRVQALRNTARTLGNDIDRTREAVEQPLREEEG